MVGHKLFKSLDEILKEHTRRMVPMTALLVTAGCAALANTPAQDLAWSRWTICHARVTSIDIKTVQLDGRISFVYSEPGDNQTMLACLRQTGKDGPALPEPISEARVGGGGGGGGM
jgi:hypothetical protein